jgi:hypothetical protein
MVGSASAEEKKDKIGLGLINDSPDPPLLNKIAAGSPFMADSGVIAELDPVSILNVGESDGATPAASAVEGSTFDITNVAASITSSTLDVSTSAGLDEELLIIEEDTTLTTLVAKSTGSQPPSAASDAMAMTESASGEKDTIEEFISGLSEGRGGNSRRHSHQPFTSFSRPPKSGLRVKVGDERSSLGPSPETVAVGLPNLASGVLAAREVVSYSRRGSRSSQRSEGLSDLQGVGLGLGTKEMATGAVVDEIFLPVHDYRPSVTPLDVQRSSISNHSTTSTISINSSTLYPATSANTPRRSATPLESAAVRRTTSCGPVLLSPIIRSDDDSPFSEWLGSPSAAQYVLRPTINCATQTPDWASISALSSSTSVVSTPSTILSPSPKVLDGHLRERERVRSATVREEVDFITKRDQLDWVSSSNVSTPTVGYGKFSSPVLAIPAIPIVTLEPIEMQELRRETFEEHDELPYCPSSPSTYSPSSSIGELDDEEIKVEILMVSTLKSPADMKPATNNIDLLPMPTSPRLHQNPTPLPPTPTSMHSSPNIGHTTPILSPLPRRLSALSLSFMASSSPAEYNSLAVVFAEEGGDITPHHLDATTYRRHSIFGNIDTDNDENPFKVEDLLTLQPPHDLEDKLSQQNFNDILERKFEIGSTTRARVDAGRSYFLAKGVDVTPKDEISKAGAKRRDSISGIDTVAVNEMGEMN